MKIRSAFLVLLLTGFCFHCVHAGEAVLSESDRLRVEVKRGRSVSKVTGGSIGEKMADFEPEVKIINDSFNDFPGNRVCVLMLGEDTTVKNNWKVIYRREFDADLQSSKPTTWVGEPFQQGFDRTLAKSGYDYEGYIVVIRNSKGEPVFAASSKSHWTQNPEKAWNLREGQEFNNKYFK